MSPDDAARGSKAKPATEELRRGEGREDAGLHFVADTRPVI